MSRSSRTSIRERGEVLALKTALIFGVTGQDGSYLAELLLGKGYKVIGVKRRASIRNTARVDHLLDDKDLAERFELLHGDISDSSSVHAIIRSSNPDEIYNLAAQSHVGVSFNEPEYTCHVDGLGVLRILEAIVLSESAAKFYQASTSELFGGLSGGLLSETSTFNPRSPYAAAKLYGYYLVKQYREAYGIPAYNGILFNHESPRRGENFVSRKVTLMMNELFQGRIDVIRLGNLEAVRDWGHAKDYVRAMHSMINDASPDDYVVSTGEAFSVKEFVRVAFEITGHKLSFDGEGEDCIARVVGHCESKIGNAVVLPLGTVVVQVDPKYFRPLEVPHLLGDSSKFRAATGWKPEYEFYDLVLDMVRTDVQ